MRKREPVTAQLAAFDLEHLSDAPFIIGIDEAGRGPLAGPVTAAAVCLSPGFYKNKKILERCALIHDSKKMKEPEREEMFEALHALEQEGELHLAIAEGSVEEIDEHNILGATRIAMQRALEAVAEKAGIPLENSSEDPLFETQLKHKCPVVLVDGRPLKPFPYKHTSVVKGDAHSFSIAAASVLAKVQRDKVMLELDKQHPDYGLAQHKGYPTELHRQMVVMHGPSPLHRKTFLKKIL